MALAALSTYRTSRVQRFLAVMIALTVVWSIGNHLFTAGHATLWLPESLVQHLPLFNQLLPVRITLYVTLVVAVATSLWLGARGGRSKVSWLTTVLAVALVLPNIDAVIPGSRTPLFRSSLQVPPFFTTGLFRHYLRRGEVVLPIP